ncbi:MAG: type II toxin-antitoxin system HipA family toxin [Pseudomonadota bacterium]
MGRRRSYAPINVFLNGRLAGQLHRESTGAISFAYDASWLGWEHAFPVSLSLPMREDRYVGALVIAVFDNLLPDNALIRSRLAERVGADGADAYSLLHAIGRDCVGALQFLPDGEEPQALDTLQGDELGEAQIAALLKELDGTPLGIRREHEFRISVTGAQEKTALLYRNGTWIKPVGTTPTTHIIKPAIGKRPNGMDLTESVENEYCCLKLMAQFGLRVANAEIASFGDQKALVIERFDRRWTGDGRLIRLPQEDMCQALSIPPTQKYQREGGPGITQIMDVLRGSDEPNQDRMDFFKANILFWLIGASDGHAKNYSIGLLPGGRFRMTPLYDVMTMQQLVDQRQVKRKEFRLAMRMGTSNHYRIDDITGRHIMETGLASGLSQKVVAEIFNQIRTQADAAIARTYADLPGDFPSALLDSIVAGMSERLSLLH